MSRAGANQPRNRLATQTSPYLLQHAGNPVDWYPWSPEALERARREDKPILLSIGYAACHWCHVMERESFEDESIARSMNESFVCIKVDREERPDLDEIYMAATVAMSGSGGWPMTVFLTPDQEPFFAGTYFPPDDKWGRPGFRSVLARIADLWRTNRATLTEQAAELTAHVREQAAPTPAATIAAEASAAAVRTLASQYDARWGGFGRAPKFPPCSAITLLHGYFAATGDERALAMATGTLDGMRRGGLYDHLAGGFARYSTDERWLVPHFEKMLYDNAQLVRVYLESYQLTGSEDHRRVARETLAYLVREMQGESGGFYSATDADSEGEEGKFFVWQPSEVEAVLGAEGARRFSAYFDVTKGGNWEGTSVLNTPRELADVARELGIPAATLAEALEHDRAKLYEARRRRVPPLLDDKVLTSWNALAIGAMAEGHRVLGDGAWLDSAERAAAFVLSTMKRPDGGLFRTWRAGTVHLDAYLEDYAFLADALIDLYEAGGEERWLREALGIAERLIEDFADPDGGAFFQTATGHEALLVRMREGHDGAIPNANAVAARALARLSHHFDRPDLAARATDALRSYGRGMERMPRAFATSLGVVEFLLAGPTELAFAGTEGDPAAKDLKAAVAGTFLPHRIVGHARVGASADLPLVRGKGPVGGRPALYVCRNFACEAPITDPTAVRDALTAHRTRAFEGRRAVLGGRAMGGFATSDGTERLRRESPHAEHGYAQLGRTTLLVSRVGFGAYRVEDGDPGHARALERALRSGVNLVDTSTNYGDGGSERLIGNVLAKLAAAGTAGRETTVVVSKVGYVQGKNLALAVERRAVGRPFAEMVEYDDDCWHCIHPEWIEDQLTRSLERLRLETLDVCLLHNPEYFLADAIKRGEGPLEAIRARFYARLTGAFRHLEQEIRRGRLRHYGVSSNTSTAPHTDPDATDLARMLASAVEAGGTNHGFAVLELPMNLREVRAHFERNTADATTSVLEHARANGIAVLVNRPLNAIATSGGLLRLADAPDIAGAPPLEAQLTKVERLESEYRREIAVHLRAAPGSQVEPATFFDWADRLGSAVGTVESLEQWAEIEGRAIAPRLAQTLAALDRALTGPDGDGWRGWRARYLPELEGLLAAIRQRTSRLSRRRGDAISSVIDAHLPETARRESLSRKALWTVASAPGVTSVLVGMRDERYVDDATAILGWPPLDAVDGALRAAASATVP